ncbi:MAG: tRNA 2-thiouridine(34) synthase MnmA [Armatimonadetes bacterium]|nr:tRNA 2-thiouridine(34) synthase MnmA [Armatimonadota bacterium]
MARDRVVVAMSGGVDSSVAAALLLEQGREVIGITMQLWSPEVSEIHDEGGCCSLSAVEDARRVANRLGIPHYVASFHALFTQSVIADFVREYARGRTPNPCVRCNQFVKFAALRRRARELGADTIATGHYACTGFDRATGRYLLRKGADPRKDQSYALYTLTQEQLAAALFPLGDLSKGETRRRAAALGLAVASRPDSQEICFVPGRDYGEFLRHRAPELAAPGPIVTRDGRVLGRHPGIAFFTTGQKRGLRLPLPYPLYVTEIHPETRTLVVGSEAELMARACVVEDLNWVAIPDLAAPLEVTARVRYNMEEQAAVLHPLGGGRARLEFAEAQRAITPGQAAVFYRGDAVLGGGTVAGLAEPGSG